MIKRIINKDVPHDKLRLHSSERNSSWGNVYDEFINSITEHDVRYYPNTEETYKKLRNFYKHEHLLLGLGSDRCIKYFFESTTGDNLIITDPSFPMYSVYGDMFNKTITKVPYTDLKFPINDFINSITENSIVVLSNPSSPVGDYIELEDIERILETKVPVLIDEAYIEFSCGSSTIKLIENYDNLYITRTFSKALGSAGMRIGVLLSNKRNIEHTSQYRDMYELPGISLKWIETILNNSKYIDIYTKKVKDVKEQLINDFLVCGIEFVLSDANWIHVRGINEPEHVILKKNCSLPNLGNDWIRLTVTDDINDYIWI